MSSKRYYTFRHLINNNDVSKLYVFVGEQNAGTDLNTLYKTDSTNELFKPFFLENPKEGEEVSFVYDLIYEDDTIETIKKKLLIHLNNERIEVSFYELYLFAQQYEDFDAKSVYQLLTNNGKNELTPNKLAQYLVNVADFDLDLLSPDKSDYSYADLVKLFSDSQQLLINKSIGQKILANTSILHYPANPYTLHGENKKLFEKPIDKVITTTNHSLLLNFGEIYNNVIFFCTAAEVIQNEEDKQAEGEAQSRELYSINIVKIYFPFLVDLNLRGIEENITISTRLDIDTHKQALMQKTEDMLQNRGFKNNMKNIDLFYKLYSDRKKELQYSAKGIKNIELVIYPSFEFSLPLDIIFKIIHATQNIPFIKYNPAKRMEKIYRLYANKIATNGKNIPYLNKTVIFKLMKDTGKHKCVSVYITVPNGTMVCVFESNGSITVKATINEIIELKNMEELISETINPIIESVNEYIEQSGYHINSFQGLDHSNIEIINIDFITDIVIEKKLNLSKIIGCLNSIFSVSNADSERDIYTMRYKRVANYNEMNDQEAFITDSLNHKQSHNDIIEGLILNFNLAKEDALLKLADFVSSQDVSQKIFMNVQIKNNPGFLTTISRNPTTNKLTITISGINAVQYLNTVPIYIDSLLRITQDKSNLYKELCTKKNGDETDDVEIVDIIAAKEVAYKDRDDTLDILPSGELENVAEEQKKEEGAEILASENEEPEPLIIETEKTKKQSNFLNLLFADDDDDDEEEEEENQEDKEMYGGGVNFKLPAEKEEEEEEGKETLKTDWTGKSLSHPNPFFTRLQEREPSLFLTHDEGVYPSYITACSWTKSHRKQPVILSQKEKEKIDKDHPGSYENAIEYGSDPKNKYWYICPRYWSLKDNVSLTEEQVKSGKYGKIIPADAKKIGKDENIFDFIDTKYHRDSKTNDYMNLQPGFQSTDSHPQGKCIPCCFKAWDSPSQKAMRKKCGMNEDLASAASASASASASSTNSTTAKAEASSPEEIASVKERVTSVLDIKTSAKVIEAQQTLPELNINYIKNADKFPLGQNQYGFLPISVQKFLHTDNKKCQISISNASLKLNHTCFLRHGVEANKSQSFIGCIADIWSGEISNGSTFISIREMKKKLINSMDINIFSGLQNGNLVDIFETSSVPAKAAKAAKAAEAEDKPKFVKNTARQEMVMRAYENFKEFLKDDTVEINYIYLWDLICQPNNNIFIKGVNLIILEMKNDDVTDNIELICPSNHYSSSLFDINKNSILILKNGNYYEPIYTRTDTERDITINRTFSLKYKGLLPNIKRTLELIKKTNNEKCVPMPSLTKEVYTFDKNISIMQLIYLLRLKKYTIEKQIIHYNDKAIGLIVSKQYNNKLQIRGMLPCYPSSPVMDLEYIWMDEDANYSQSYEKTVDFLNMVYKDFVPTKILCKPHLKVLEDELIVGVITQTNQFIAVSEPTQDIYGEDGSTDYALPSIINELDETEVDKASITSTTIDNERVDFIKKIRLETEFYNVFRNTLRTILGEYENKGIKDEIEKILMPSPDEILYLEKLRLLTVVLKNLIIPHSVEFVEYTPEKLYSITSAANCYKSNKEKCERKLFCEYTRTSGADTSGADTSGADTSGADTSGADTSGADTSGADTSGADTSGADTSGADTNENEDDKNSCKLLIPNLNLINGQENEKLYLGRIADELIRYTRIKSFIFQPKAFLSFSKLKYNLRNDEIILLQSLLNNDYFKDLVQAEINPYINQTNSNTYDTAKPLKTLIEYSNKINLEETIDELESSIIECEKPIIAHLNTKYWSKIFPKDTKVFVYNTVSNKKHNICSFEIILSIIQRYDKETRASLTKDELKETLISEYEKYTKKYKTELLTILRLEGKKAITDQIALKQITFEEMIRSEEYYATLLDMWLLCEIYNVPVVFISSKKIPEINKLNLLVKIQEKAGPSNAAPIGYFYIKIPAIGNTGIENIPVYKLLFHENSAQFPITLLNDANVKFNTVADEGEKLIMEDSLSIADYLQQLYDKNKKIPKPAMNKKKIVIV